MRAESCGCGANKESYEGSTHCGDVFRGKLIGGVGDEQAGFPHGAVAHHHALYGLHLKRERRMKSGEVETIKDLFISFKIHIFIEIQRHF